MIVESEQSAMRDFPESFLWGSGTAAHQVEGYNTASDWWHWELAPGSTRTSRCSDP